MNLDRLLFICLVFCFGCLVFLEGVVGFWLELFCCCLGCFGSVVYGLLVFWWVGGFSGLFWKVQKMKLVSWCIVSKWWLPVVLLEVCSCVLGVRPVLRDWRMSSHCLTQGSLKPVRIFLALSMSFGSPSWSANWNNQTKHKTSWSEFPLACFSAESHCVVVQPLSALPAREIHTWLCQYLWIITYDFQSRFNCW